MKKLAILKCFVLVTTLCADGSALAQTGQFIGELKYKPIGGGNHEIIDYFEFVSPNGTKWGVPKGSITNGASIPSSLWSIWGHPYGGQYVRAAVVHDYYCEIKTRDWKDVHRVFYDAMLADKESVSRAKWMYLAVYYAGPRWSKGEAIENKKVCQTFKRDNQPDRVVCAVRRIRVPTINLIPPARPRSTDELAKAKAAAKVEGILAKIDNASEIEQMSLDQIELMAEDARREVVEMRR